MGELIKTNKPVLLKRISLFFLIVLFSGNIYSQFERFKSFTVSDGICHSFVYTINQDKNGFIWIGTGEGLCRFDGYEFVSFSSADTLANDVVSTSFKDSIGDLWFGFNDGLLLSWDGSRFVRYDLPIKTRTSITSITQTPEGEIFVATQNSGCFIVSSNGESRAVNEDLKSRLISSTLFAKDYLLLGSSNGFEKINYSDGKLILSSLQSFKEFEYINIQVVKKTPKENTYFIGTEDSGLFLCEIIGNEYNLIQIGKGSDLETENVQDAILLPDNSLWISTFYGGLIKLTDFNLVNGSFSSRSVFKKGSGFTTNYIKTLYFDREENLWVGTYGDGIELLTEQAISFMSFEDFLQDNNVLSVASSDSLLWLGGENGLLKVNLVAGKRELFNNLNGLPNDKIISLSIDNGILWIGTDKSGIYRLNTETGTITSFFRIGNTIGNSINNLLVDQNILYAATKNGIYSFDLESGQQFHYNTERGLPHNDIEDIFIDNDNRLLFATRSNGVFEINDKGEVQDYFTVGQYELEFNSIIQDTKKQVWVSTYGQGIFLLKPDTVINLTARDGLKSNYCYSVYTADSNFVWVGHRLGLSRLNINDYSVKIFDLNVGIEGDCNFNAVAKDLSGKLFFGTTDGLIVYDTKEGSKGVIPPKTNIIRLLINDKEYDYTKPIVLPYSAYKIRIEFVGLNYNAPGNVKYKYFLDGYDLEWSDVSDLRYAIYSRVEDGEYEFKVRSFGYDGQSLDPVGFSLRIRPPFWKTWWFITLMSILAIMLVVFIIKYRERRQKAIQEYLEKSLDERTREVVEQKEEIEIKNRDITDSINYAQRIQTSILPAIKKLQQSFAGSFIFYQPRDIVSGDFYWFDKINDDKIVIVCADSTGHGVPGAFMSMIGTTLIKDICLSQKVDSPSEILKELDFQLSTTLNQNVDEAKSNDGMDIMVCEIDINKNYLRYASAMRPMIIYKNGEQIYIKGSRSSIGGQYDNKDEKDFFDKGVQLSKGDLIYMFSDGYPDQFGGPLGKKFKMVRLKNLLKDIHKKPMEEQYEYVKSTFNLWKEEHEQVDDVLFMGIKL